MGKEKPHVLSSGQVEARALGVRIEAEPSFYFKRLWNPARSHPDEEVVAFKRVGRDLHVFTGRLSDMPEDFEEDEQATAASIYNDPLLIYGRKIVSPYPEDQGYLASLEDEGFIFAENFSILCVEGEVGSQPLSELTEIEQEEFEAARARGWA